MQHTNGRYYWYSYITKIKLIITTTIIAIIIIITTCWALHLYQQTWSCGEGGNARIWSVRPKYKSVCYGGGGGGDDDSNNSNNTNNNKYGVNDLADDGFNARTSNLFEAIGNDSAPALMMKEVMMMNLETKWMTRLAAVTHLVHTNPSPTCVALTSTSGWWMIKWPTWLVRRESKPELKVNSIPFVSSKSVTAGGGGREQGVARTSGTEAWRGGGGSTSCAMIMLMTSVGTNGVDDHESDKWMMALESLCSSHTCAKNETIRRLKS